MVERDTSLQNHHNNQTTQTTQGKSGEVPSYMKSLRLKPT